MTYDVAVIGGGPAGLAAALSAKRNGAEKVIIFERDEVLGGILNQCIHNGFGLHRFKEELTGPEYAFRFIEEVENTNISIKLNTMVLEITDNHHILSVSSTDGYMDTDAKSIVLAMGCRERTRGAIAIPGDRPAGIFTAGAAQRYVNIEGYLIGRRVVILGSGDIGLIMARRMTLEGAKVLACVELCPYSNGLNRNIVQCLHDFDIPLYLSHTITNIKGKNRLEEVTIQEVDANKKPIPGTELVLPCDTLLLSVGLIPENELSRNAHIPLDVRTSGAVVYNNRETMVPGIFAAGNVLHVHDLVDFVSDESEIAGEAAARYALGQMSSGKIIQIQNGNQVSYTVPQMIRLDGNNKFYEIYFRVCSVMADEIITVTDDTHRKVCEFKRDYLAPGEMEKIGVPVSLIKEECTCLTVSVGKEVQ